MCLTRRTCFLKDQFISQQMNLCVGKQFCAEGGKFVPWKTILVHRRQICVPGGDFMYWILLCVIAGKSMSEKTILGHRRRNLCHVRRIYVSEDYLVILIFCFGFDDPIQRDRQYIILQLFSVIFLIEGSSFIWIHSIQPQRK